MTDNQISKEDFYLNQTISLGQENPFSLGSNLLAGSFIKINDVKYDFDNDVDHDINIEYEGLDLRLELHLNEGLLKKTNLEDCSFILSATCKSIRKSHILEKKRLSTSYADIRISNIDCFTYFFNPIEINLVIYDKDFRILCEKKITFKKKSTNQNSPKIIYTDHDFFIKKGMPEKSIFFTHFEHSHHDLFINDSSAENIIFYINKDYQTLIEASINGNYNDPKSIVIISQILEDMIDTIFSKLYTSCYDISDEEIDIKSNKKSLAYELIINLLRLNSLNDFKDKYLNDKSLIKARVSEYMKSLDELSKIRGLS